MNRKLLVYCKIVFLLLFIVLSISFGLGPSQVVGKSAATSDDDNEGWSILLEAEEGLYAANAIEPSSNDTALLFGSGHQEGGYFAYAAQIKVDATLGWQKKFANMEFYHAISTRDGGYLIAGRFASLTKIDHHGEIVWQKVYGAQSGGSFSSIAETAGGDFVVVGGGPEGVVLKLSADGAVIWRGTWDGEYYDRFEDVVLTVDDHYLLVGSLNMDPWIVKLAPDGTVIWQKRVAEAKPLYSFSMAAAVGDGNVIIYSYNDGVPWLAQLLADGTLGWQKTIRSSKGRLQFEDMKSLPNGNVAIVGLRERYGEDIVLDGWAMEIDSDGRLQWQRSYRAIGDIEIFSSAGVSADGDVYAAGSSSKEGGGPDAAWALKLAGEGSIARCPSVFLEEAGTSTTSFELEDVAVAGSVGSDSAKAADWPAENFAINVINICPLPHLSIAKSGPQTAVGGLPFSYSLTITNNSDEPLTDVEIRDRLPDGATYVSGGSLNEEEVTWSIAELKGGAQATEQLTISARQEVTNEAYEVSCAEGYRTIGEEAVVTEIENLVSLPIINTGYCANFTDDFSDPASGWPIANNDQWRADYVANQYELQLRAPGILTIPAPACARWTYVVEADMYWESAPGPGIGLLIDVSADGRLYSILTLDTTQKKLRYQDLRESSIRTVGSPFIKAGRSNNHLRVTRSAGKISVEINNELAETFYVDKVREETAVGFATISSASAPANVARFDNFSYTWLSPSHEVTGAKE